MTEEIRDVIADSPIAAGITDLHVWQVGKGKFSCIVSLATAQPASPEDFKKLPGIHEELVHVTVEVNNLKAA